MPVLKQFRSTRFSGAQTQGGASLIVVMLILIVVSILGIGAAQISMMGERSARNDRDTQVAWQAAEAALMDAEFDIRGPGGTRATAFGHNFSAPDNTRFALTGCGTGNDKGLCVLLDEAQAASGTRQKWLTVDFTVADSTAQTAKYGDFTGSGTYPTGTGVRSAKEPRYMIEAVPDYQAQRDKSLPPPAQSLYRVTAMGFGPSPDIQAVAQMILRP